MWYSAAMVEFRRHLYDSISTHLNYQQLFYSHLDSRQLELAALGPVNCHGLLPALQIPQ